MKIGIIGAGFTGLAAAHQLIKNGHDVTIFEKDTKPGGLAIGYQEKGWDWSLEHHYHHWFSDDSYALNLAKELGYEVIIKKPHTNVYVHNKIYQLDSLKAFLTFPELTLLERLRHVLVLGLLFRLNPFWKPLEKLRVTTILPTLIGEKAYKLIWEPQLSNKLGKLMDEISLVWFWARINKRTPKLAYPSKGFLHFAEFITKNLTKKGVTIYFDTQVAKISQTKETCTIVTTTEKQYTFDKIIVTVPSFLFNAITPQLPDDYKKTLGKLKGLGATNLVLRLKKEFLPNNTYWLSICDNSSPVMAIIEHTHFMDKKHYNNEHIVYLGNYLSSQDEVFGYSKEKLLEKYDPFLKKINPDYKNNIIGYEVFRAPFAQPIIPVNYSKMIPPMKTPLSNVYLANIEQVYPWDRGTNYAIELGFKVTQLINDKNT